MHQVKVTGGAHVQVVVMNQFASTTQEVYLRPLSNKNQSLFYVENGSLELIGQESRRLVISGKNGTDYYTVNPLVNLGNNCTSFKAEYCDFRQSGNRAIYINSNELETFELSNCIFRDTVHAKNGASNYGYGRGGAIYMPEYYGSASDPVMVDIDNFTLTNCTFNGNTAASYGGAVALYGRVDTINVTGCTFDGCSANGNNGGAFFTAGRMGVVNFTNTSFLGCEAKNHGGAVCFQTITNVNGNYQRVNDVTFTGCTFTDCTAKASHGGAISVAAQTNSVTIQGCTFTGCKARVNGGAVSLYQVGMSGTDPAFSTSENTPGTANAFKYNWGTDDAPKYYTTIQRVLIDGQTTFVNCRANQNGGAIEFAANSYVVDADISNTTIDGCKTVSNGSAVFVSSAVVEDLALTNLTVKNCDFVKSTYTTDAAGNKTYAKDDDGFYVDAQRHDPVEQGGGWRRCLRGEQCDGSH